MAWVALLSFPSSGSAWRSPFSGDMVSASSTSGSVSGSRLCHWSASQRASIDSSPIKVTRYMHLSGGFWASPDRWPPRVRSSSGSLAIVGTINTATRPTTLIAQARRYWAAWPGPRALACTRRLDVPPRARASWTLRPDLLRDDHAFGINRMYLGWVVLGLILPTLAGGLAGGWSAAATGLVWGGLGRIFLVHHVTWSINSLCHMSGNRAFETGDDSRNNVLCGVFALGEGWHNNHHAFPTSARHGLAWWQLDATYLFIRMLATLRLAWSIKLPSPEIQERQTISAALICHCQICIYG